MGDVKLQALAKSRKVSHIVKLEYRFTKFEHMFSPEHIKCQCCPHIETRQLIYRANQ